MMMILTEVEYGQYMLLCSTSRIPVAICYFSDAKVSQIQKLQRKSLNRWLILAYGLIVYRWPRVS
jgi:hypothetical protein